MPNTTGDGTPNVHALTVHLRALSGRDILALSGGTTLLGSGETGASGRLAASGNPASTGLIGLPAWTELFWESSTAGTTFTPAGSGLTKEVGGSVGSFEVQL